MKPVLVIINLRSRSGQRQRERALRLLSADGLTLIDAPPTTPEDLPALIGRYRQEVDSVVLGGGDGTLHAAAPALVRHQLTLGVLPLGTANDLARTLGIPGDLEAACRVIRTGDSRLIDLGQVNGRYFFNVAHIGLGTEVGRLLSAPTKRRWGPLGYPYAALRALSRQRPFQALIRAGERAVSLSVIQIAVGNGCYYGGGHLIDQDASIEDGRLDLYAIQPRGLLPLLAAGPALHRGRLQRLSGSISANIRECEISTPDPLPVTADGEEIGTTPAQFRVAARALRVFSTTAKG